MLARHELRLFRAVTAAHTVRLSSKFLGAMLFLAVLAAIVALAWFVYRPGLSGAFLFDDLGSLPKLGATGPVDNWATFWRFITSGTADPTGRPLALLSFLVDARNWPANPYPFKVTNVILHLINGALLAWVLWKLGKVLAKSSDRSSFRTPRSGDPESVARANEETNVDGHAGPMTASGFDPAGRPGTTMDQRGCAIAALFGAGVWLLHPLLVSTTLYVVQREAMLPATFTLIGMLGWMASRKALALGHVKRALIGFALSAWLCTLLAILSKANGALLPLLLLLTEWIVLSRRPMPNPQRQRSLKFAIMLFLIVPSVLLIAYLLSVIPGYVATAPATRGWTVGQRLLTEPRVLTDYLRLLFVPSAHSSGLFNDAFPVSADWLHPTSTLPCIALVLALIGTGFVLRKKCPALALALLFYFAAQLMESGWVPLELYFEHRNYLPAMLLFWPIGLALAYSGTLRFLRTTAAAAILIVLAVLTAQRATLWGNAPLQAQIWAAFNPDSARAQTSAALYDLQSGRPRLAAARLRLAMPSHPDDLQIPVNLISAECKLGAVRPETITAARAGLASDRTGGDVAFNWFGDALTSVEKHACSGLDYATLQSMLDAAKRNQHWEKHAGLRANLLHLEGTLALAQHEPAQALQDFDAALVQLPRVDVALSQAATLASAGYPKLGLKHLDYLDTLPTPHKTGFSMSRVHAWVLTRQGYWQNEIEHLRTAMTASAHFMPHSNP